MRMKFLAVITVLLFVTGCQADPDQTEHQTKTQEAEQTADKQLDNKDAQEVAKRLAKLATSVTQVNDATAIVMGNVAVVGIDVDAKIDRPRVGVVKYTVAQALKKDPYGVNALVTADPDIVQRIREMSTDIGNGRPIAGITEELADIVGRIIPQASRDVEKEANQNGNAKPVPNNQKLND
jgi:YhcN/YlaJ family sporulation lipoprotein